MSEEEAVYRAGGMMEPGLMAEALQLAAETQACGTMMLRAARAGDAAGFAYAAAGAESAARKARRWCRGLRLAELDAARVPPEKVPEEMSDAEREHLQRHLDATERGMVARGEITLAAKEGEKT
ncbi:MAG: hypothetical protein PHR35_20585 [Kiritimatiellae bacterium]|nr:hypothetical protein [Kiritimatiellia bacterium]